MNEPEARPDPDSLLARVTAQEERERRAKLKIFFGFAPGVGKTFAMLESARRLRAEGVDVVAACVETHGRTETAELLEGLEILPRRRVSYRGVALEELDLDAALARRPSLILVDELAHTNAPGSRHIKRWQDVLELLETGIDVHTTLNVQHVESLNDVVAQVTSVRVRETVPDSILDRADEIELIDLPPEALLERLREGKVYIPDQARHAAGNFFRLGNLLSLRELALRRTAERVDHDVQAYRETHAIDVPWPASERLLVCLGPGPSSSRVLRAARRLATGLRAPWIVAVVEVSTRTPLSERDRGRLDENLRLAESMGAEVVRLTGARVAEALLAYARKRNVTRLLVGKPRHPRWRDLLRGSLIEELVRKSGTLDVQVIAGDDSPPGGEKNPPIAPVKAGRHYGAAALAVALATGLSAIGSGLLDSPDVVMLYLLAIMIVAVRFGRGASLFASALSVASFDFFFVPPTYTFSVEDIRYTLTFVMMFAVGFVISTLASRLRFQGESARVREERTAALLTLSRELAAAVDERSVAQTACAQIRAVFEIPAAILLPNNSGELVAVAEAGSVELGAQDLAVAHWSYDLGKNAGRGTDTLPGSRVACSPLVAGGATLGVLIVVPDPAKARLDGAQQDLLDAFARQAALAIERARLAEEAKSSALRARAEEMRSSLLSTVSHDLRSPLAAITGAATTLRDADERLGDRQRDEMLDTICEEAERLERLVGNLLDMTRLEAGGLPVKQEWVPLEEVVGSALTRTESALAGRNVTTSLPASLPLLRADPVLLEQAFVNLLENAAKHTPAGTPVEIAARAEKDAVVVEVSDRGPGFSLAEAPRLFEKFVRGTGTRESGAVPGVGLGLAICRGIVEAHGGSVTAKPREGGGATFLVTLPIDASAPPVDATFNGLDAPLPGESPE